MKKPVVSVVIPVKELSYYLMFENLPALAKQSFKQFEVIVLPNTHTPYDLTLAQKYKFLRIIPTHAVTRPAQKRDIGVKAARGAIIAFIDDDAYPQENWLEEAMLLFNKRKVAAVCGPGVIPPAANMWERIFEQVLKSPIGAGGYSYRFVKGHARYVDDYPSMNFFIRKNMFNALGGFNSDYWPGEDSKLCNDLVHKKRGKIWYDPRVVIFHHRRDNLKSYLKQQGNYGFHRGAFFAHGDKNSKKIQYVIPSVFVFYIALVVPVLLISLVTSLTRHFNTAYMNLLYAFVTPMVLYISICGFLFLLTLITTFNIKIALFTPMVLFLTHARYGIEFMKGFLKGYKHKNNLYG